MSILLENLTKRYERHSVVSRVGLTIGDGEFFVMLGPSGSGKSTILRMIAGLTEVDEGRVVLHGRDVTALTPQARDIGFVFQHYALFQHMTVGDNIEFALRIRKVGAAERRKRRDELLGLVGRRYLGRPLLSLTRAAARIGAGDLASTVPTAQGAEIGALASTLEEMRQRLSTLTTDLRRREAEANAILTGIVEGVFTVDRERTIRYLNPQMAALLGIEPEAALGQFCGDVLRPQGENGRRPCENHCPIVHARFRGGARATEHLRLPDGSRRTVVITSSAMDEHGQVQVIRDETEVEASRRLRDTILSTISHEFRTPLSAQLASLELLIEQLPALSLDQIRQLVLSLQRGTTRLAYLIDNLLESARIEAGQLAIRRRTIALDGVLEDALEMMRPLLFQREQEVDLDLPYPMPAVSGDATRLVQVFVNLLANASKFAPVGSTISIGGEVVAHSVTVWVDDEGPGMPPGAADTLFSRFVRSRADEPEQSGVGLGLWIVQSIVERHGGRVAALPLIQGTRLAVTLPVGGNDETAGR